ncbi:glutamate-cysteine ligase family protein [Streptomyces sp. NPDC085927]|uniref:glutamate-cysteine ligase family protein n=1 Tax=Streptomyces sp. NPDC085927 TaxID=3365738 RepID=UPI0037D08011
MELEWFVAPSSDPTRRPTREELALLAHRFEKPLPRGGLISWEPGGQLELSSAPHESLRSCLEAAAADLAVVREQARLHGLRLVAGGLDPRPPEFAVALPRYQALRRYYARWGSSGDALLCNTASVQVNVDAGDASDGWRGRSRRWLVANSLGPVLMAMFANSPVRHGEDHRRGTALSGRQLLRFQTDRFRSGPLPYDGDPRRAWTRYALDANVVAIRRPAREDTRPGVLPPAAGGPRYLPEPDVDGGRDSAPVWTTAPEGLSLRQWLRGAGPGGVRPEDVLHHLKTLVPPVRACGHLELRMIDAQHGDDWMVPVAVVAALMDDRTTSDAAAGLVSGGLPPPTRQDWIDAARRGMADPGTADLAQRVMRLALTGLHRLDVSPSVLETVERFADRHTLRGLAPAQRRWLHRTAVA